MMLNTAPTASVGGLTLMSAGVTGANLIGPLSRAVWPMLVTGHAIVAVMSLLALTLTVGKLLPGRRRDLRWAPSPVNRPLPEPPTAAGRRREQ